MELNWFAIRKSYNTKGVEQYRVLTVKFTPFVPLKPSSQEKERSGEREFERGDEACRVKTTTGGRSVPAVAEGTSAGHLDFSLTS